MNISITKIQSPKDKPKEIKGFGHIFTDHMFLMDYDKKCGWHDARIVPYDALKINPASIVLHYGAEIFEGLKAYKTNSGKVQLFRPFENAKRMAESAKRITLPVVNENDFVEAITTLLKVDEDWVPEGKNETLYIRPFEFGNDDDLSLHEINKVTFAIILSPCGHYYAEGINPVKIIIEDEDVRAVRGGTGFAKCGGNYGASFRSSVRAEKKGFTQVLWLDGVYRKYIEEVGSMNVMFKIDGVIVTPELNGSILPGITRKSCIEVLKDNGYKVEERLISIDEIFEAFKNGKLEEAWGCGTAAVISPIGELHYKGEKYTINNNKIGETTQFLYDTITGIQKGIIADKYNWIVTI